MQTGAGGAKHEAESYWPALRPPAAPLTKRRAGGMTKQVLDLGTVANDGTGDTLRAGGDKVNDNFDDLYAAAGPWNINYPKAAADTPDDEFNAAALDAKWTAVNGSAGNVALLGSSGGVYELFEDESFLAVQIANGSEVNLRQDYTLPDGKSIVAAVSLSVSINAQSGLTNNDLRAGLVINDTDTGPFDGVDVGVVFDVDTDGWRIAAPNGFNSTPISGTIAAVGNRIYFRVSRSGLSYYSFFSFDGMCWNPLGSQSLAGALSNVWLGFTSPVAFTETPKPIMLCHWIRQGTNDLLPW